jgi:NAD(P)-dependent dehydrogenase (short-subunit alcohol dehydrogenase family)
MNTPTYPSPFRDDALDGYRILITGGGSGLGAEMALHLAEHGADVHLWGRRESALAETRERIEATAPGRVHSQTVNVRDAESVDEAMEQLWQEHGPLTGLINNAAANFIAPAETISPNGYEAISSTVMDGSYFTTQAAGRRWIASGRRGSVLSTVTTWVWTGSAYVVPSAMSKAAVDSMTKSLAVEWAKYGIRLNAVAPGPFPTDFTWQVLGIDNAANALSAEAGMPTGRTGQMSELANLVLFLISDAADYVTGQTIAIDGAQMYAGPGTFASLSAMSDADWEAARSAAKKATAESKAHRKA